jgi:hypothetical protein
MEDGQAPHSNLCGLIDARSGNNQSHEQTSTHAGKRVSEPTNLVGLGKAGRSQCHFPRNRF